MATLRSDLIPETSTPANIEQTTQLDAFFGILELIQLMAELNATEGDPVPRRLSTRQT